MTRIELLRIELNRLNTEITTDTGVIRRNKLKRISVITDTLAREALENPVAVAGFSLDGWRFFPVLEDGQHKLKVQFQNGVEWQTCSEFVCVV
jgi:hypothetical protein